MNYLAFALCIFLTSIPSQAFAEDGRKDDPNYSVYQNMATKLGFETYCELIDLRYAHKTLGEKKLQHMLIIIDDTAMNYHAIQNLPPYVIYGAYYGYTKRVEKVAVLDPDKKSAKRGEFINKHTLYSFIEARDATSIDGFKTKMLVIKPLKQNKFKFNNNQED